ncbi:MAG: hypothetical protein GX660_09710 [Clostridiaceae bacterium]|nr:hypothetical protein [Clostridiaceae bacterium]
MLILLWSFRTVKPLVNPEVSLIMRREAGRGLIGSCEMQHSFCGGTEQNGCGVLVKFDKFFDVNKY